MSVSPRQTIGRTVALSLVVFQTALRGQHRRSLLGYLWLFAPATAATLTAGYVRSRGLLSFSVPDMPYAVFVFAGTMLWQVFLDALNVPLAQLAAHRAVVTRLRCPHEGLILAGMWMVLLNTAIRLGALLVLCAVVGMPVAASVWWLPLAIAALAVLGLAIGMVLAPLGLLYDDIGRGLGIATALLFFVMPVAYPLAATGWQRLNPVLPLINAGRGALVGTGSPLALAVPLLAGLALLALSWLFYRVAQPFVIERLG